MNNTCGTCGGFIGNFIWSGQGAKICNCSPNCNYPNSCNHCYCKKEVGDKYGTSLNPNNKVAHKICCNCGNRQIDIMSGTQTF